MLAVRPSSLPIVLDETALYRAYARESGYDMLASSSGATYTAATSRQRATLAYHFDASMLGGSQYELGHVAEASYRYSLAGDYGTLTGSFPTRTSTTAAYS